MHLLHKLSCFLLLFALFSSCSAYKGLVHYTDHSYNVTHWMSDLKDIIYNQSLLNIQIPGTHDSGAYEFTNAFSPMEPTILDDLIKICADLHIDIYSFIKNWSLTQDTTIYEQLVGGIRYLDLRACYIGDDWYTEHFLVGTRTQDLLNDIKQFLTENTGEVLVIEFGNLVPLGDERSLVNMIEQTLGQWLTPVMDLNQTTIGEMISKSQRVVLLYPLTNITQNYSFLWNKTIWEEGVYANKDKLKEMMAWNEAQIALYGGDGTIWELSWTLTTQDSDIIKTLLDPFIREKTLKDFAIEADAALSGFAQQYNNYRLGNILLLDFWEFSPIINYTISQNIRDCHDDPLYTAYKKNDQYCRYFFKKGECTNPTKEAWMKEHCPLSCGVC